MIYDRLADLVVLGHGLFILFVVFGAWLALLRGWRKPILWLHVPALTWGAATEFFGIVCPLTYLENYLRDKGASDVYSTSFVEQYLVPFVYPAELDREIQWLLGDALVVFNLVAYLCLWWRFKFESRG